MTLETQARSLVCYWAVRELGLTTAAASIYIICYVLLQYVDLLTKDGTRLCSAHLFLKDLI